MYANFMWKFKSQKMSWDDVYKTKNKGGLGIRRLDDIAKEISIKLVQKFLQGDSLRAKWLKNKYCKNKNFWTTQIRNSAPNTWKSILKARAWCKGLVDRKISNSEETHMWFDPWLNGSSLIDKMGWQYLSLVGGPNNKVSSLIINQQWSGYFNSLPNPIIQNIKKIKVHNWVKRNF